MRENILFQAKDVLADFCCFTVKLVRAPGLRDFSSRQRGPSKFIAICSADFLFSHVRIEFRKTTAAPANSDLGCF